MAKSKNNEFELDAKYIADIAKAMSHPARIQILKILSEMNVCMCGDIVELLPLAQSTVSQHLKELKRVGLIQGEIDGPKVCYCIDSGNLETAKHEFEKIFHKITKKGSRSCKTQTK